MPPIIIVLICVVVFCVVVILCVGGYLLWENMQKNKSQQSRVEQAVETKQEGFGKTQEEVNAEVAEKAFEAVRKDKSASNIPWLNKLMNKFLGKQIQQIYYSIDQTGLSIKVSEFILFCGLVGMIGALLVHKIMGIPLAGVLLGYVPYLMLNSMREKRKAKFVQQLPSALDLMNSDLRAGMDIQEVFKHITEDMSPPISEEFQKIVAEVNLGLPVDDAIMNLSKRIDVMDVQILCNGLVINRELGGDLSRLASNLASTVRDRFKLKGIIKALTAETNGSMYLMMAMPVVLFLILKAVSPESYNSFLEVPLGQNILKGCGASMFIGYSIMKKMSDIEA